MHAAEHTSNFQLRSQRYQLCLTTPSAAGPCREPSGLHEGTSQLKNSTPTVFHRKNPDLAGGGGRVAQSVERIRLPTYLLGQLNFNALQSRRYKKKATRSSFPDTHGCMLKNSRTRVPPLGWMSPSRRVRRHCPQPRCRPCCCAAPCGSTGYIKS